MIIKRLILALLTVLAIVRVISSLGESLSQPQIQSRLELYQTNLVLNITEFSVEGEQANLQNAIDSLLGKEPLEAAEKQYQNARQQLVVSRDNFKAQLAKISTNIDQVVDVFYVRDVDGQKVDSEKQVSFIKEVIYQRLPKII